MVMGKLLKIALDYTTTEIDDGIKNDHGLTIKKLIKLLNREEEENKEEMNDGDHDEYE